MRKKQQRYEDIIHSLQQKQIDFVQRTITFPTGEVSVIYIKTLTNRSALMHEVIRPLVEHSGSSLKAAFVMNSVITTADCVLETDDNLIAQHLLDGRTVLLFSGEQSYLTIDFKHVEKRSIDTPQVTYTMRGARDCFIENIESNLSLIRYRIKDENLRIDSQEVGRRTKTHVCVLYLEDVANDVSVSEVKKRIGKIDVDGIIESGELQAFMLNKNLDLFPQMGIVERSDMACGALLEGKVVVLVDGSAWALIAPKVMSEFLWSCDDFYDNKVFGTFMRILRFIALLISFTATSLYVAVVSYHSDVLPSSYVIAIAQTRAKVPFNALIEVLFIELIVELIRESLIRVPSKIGTAIGIVGAIIIGQAAVSAGVFSPLLLIVVSISLIASFVPSDYTLISPIRILKFLLIIATSILGMYGFTLVIILVLANLVSINTFGVPYLSPVAPWNGLDAFKSLFYSKAMAPTRPNFLNTKDKIRGKRKQ